MSLKIKNLFNNFEDFKVLKNISLELKKEEINGLLGVNGVWKSTLMRILTGYYDLWNGKIILDGIDLKKELNKVQRLIGLSTRK